MAYQGIGDAYLKLNDKQKAKIAYEKVAILKLIAKKKI